MEYVDFVQKLAWGEQYHFARYGDGEWNVMLGKHGKNVDGHEYQLPGLQAEMLQTVREQRGILYGMQPLAARIMKDPIAKLLEGTFIPWINADVFHHASEHGELNSFVKQLRKMRCCIVGPKHLVPMILDTSPTQVGTMLIEIPNKNCYEVQVPIGKALLKKASEIDVFLFSASFLSNILIWKLHTLLTDKWLIDVGSLWDPYVGANSRQYHKRLDKVKEKNFA